jgi:CheY-like chemotaxis protein
MTAVTGNILVVDDQATNRMKMSLAVKTLGHTSEVVSDGGAALTRLRQSKFDLVLLDIVMPGMSGFEVLETMKSDQKLRDIPVIVISALEEMDSIVTAIEKGAEDFLPKAFDPILLRARVTACLEKKRLRDLEVAYLEQVEVLTRAAAILEAGNFNPARLPVQTVATRPDALGKLARVFLKMAQEVYEREHALRRRVATLRGGFMLIGVGLLWGIVAPLAKLASFTGRRSCTGPAVLGG